MHSSSSSTPVAIITFWHILEPSVKKRQNYLVAALRNLGISLLIAHSVSAQQAGDLTLGGSVVNAKTGEPIARALVEITNIDAPRARNNPVASQQQPPAVRTRSAFTDVTGVFRFSGLATGRYSIHASKPQFLDSAIARTQAPWIDLDASTSTQQIALAPLGVITGRILDQDGLPASGVNVICLSAQILNGMAQLHADRSAMTDDRGLFRFWNLTPGKYYVKANGAAGRTALYEGAAPVQAGDESIEPVYFGGGATLESATPIVIAGGSSVQADLHVAYRPAFKVRGTLRGFAAGRAVKFDLVMGSDDVSPAVATLNNSTGRFEIEAVLAGSYTLHATQDENAGEIPIQIRDSDLDGLQMSLSPPISVPVTVQIPQGNAGARRRNLDPNSDDDDDLSNYEGTCTPVLYPESRLFDPRLSTGKRVSKTPTGTMITGLTPGKYRVHVQCNEAWLQSAVWGSQDLSRDNLIALAPLSSPPAIQILASSGGGTVKGKFTTGEGTATLIFVPQFSTAAEVSTLFLAPNQAAGSFQQTKLAPGDYVVWALADSARIGLEYNNPAILRKLPDGIRVHVSEDAAQEITIDKVIRDVE